MKKLFNLIVDLFVAGTESKRKIGAPALFLLLPFRTRNGSLKTHNGVKSFLKDHSFFTRTFSSYHAKKYKN